MKKIVYQAGTLAVAIALVGSLGFAADFKQDAKKVGDSIKHGTEKVGDSLKSGTHKVGDMFKKGGHKVKKTVKK